uniref:RanBD1 domain-containing protein n=1 Tax=Anopheles farauti TaxID=69004 RepID=A0A182Q2K0_9DIPT
MAKRGPQSTLNHLNWNETEEPEEMGEFAKASDDVIKHRVIKKARRRVTDDADSTAAAASSSVFGGFKGFASTPLAKAGTDGPKTFSFLSTLGAPAAGKTNGNGTSTVSSSGTGIGTPNAAAPMFSFGSNAATAASAVSDAGKKAFPTFGSAASLKADSTDGAKSAPTSSGFGISSTKEGGTDSSKNLFSLATSSAQPTSTDSAAKPFAFGSLGAKTSDSMQPGKTFTFGSPAGGKDSSTSATSPKGTFTFGSFAAKPETGDGEKKSLTFSSSVTSPKDSTASTAPKTAASKDSLPKPTFMFVSIAPKPDASEATAKKSFTFGSPSANKDKPASTEAASPASKPTSSDSFGTGIGKTGFGSLTSPLANATDANKKATFAFGASDSSSQVNTGNKTSGPSTTATPTESSDSVVKKMFNFANAGTNSAPATGSQSSATDTKKKVKTFEDKVVELNSAFLWWIHRKLHENTFCKLHVVFRDYERHFARIESEMTPEEVEELGPYLVPPRNSTPLEKNAKEAANPDQKKKEKDEKEEVKEKQPEPEKVPPKTGFFFGTMAASPKESSKTPVPATSAANAPAPSSGGFAIGAAKQFSFGATSSSTVSTSSPAFFAGASTFGNGKPAVEGGFTFGNVAKPTPAPDSSATGAADKEADADADEDEPPKVEFTPVEEKDSLFSKRCKLFVKTGGAYSDRGVGTLHVKKVDGKVQVLVRADTSLGNILLNIILNESVPLQRMGKNNVMMICLPTPDSKPPPTSVLLRVKTTEEADELYETLLKFKPK